MRKRVLIIGANGFTGRHLTAFLLRNSSLRLYTSGSVRAVRPDIIYNLKGSFTNDFGVDFDTNVRATQKLLDAILSAELKTRILLVGSSAEYGFPLSSNAPVGEDHPLAPVSVHGLAKLVQTELMRLYIKLYGMNIVMVRPFNLKGNGVSPTLFFGKMEQEIARYKKGLIRKIITGNLSVERDYIDVDDAVKYYATVMERGTQGEVYNVGNGKSVSLRLILKGMLTEAGLSFSVVREGGHTIPGKIVVPKIFADIRKIQALTK